jgi:HD superfamily phosphohydrolase
MVYYDPVYSRHLNGNWRPPLILEQLSRTPEAVRARRIAQAAAPDYLLMRGPIPSRFQHGMGVAFLADRVLKKNPDLKDYQNLFLSAALMHDWGLPCFSHLAEPLLEKMTGMNGESFLGFVLEIYGWAKEVLKDFGVDYQDVVKVVTGDFEPLGEIINGSLDLDNLDNILRYAIAASLPGKKPNVIKVAVSFRFIDGKWYLLEDCLEDVKKWQALRRQVYSSIYSNFNLSPVAMLYRAIYLAYQIGLIDANFFLMNDDEAIDYLSRCGGEISRLLERLISWEWYEEVFSLQFESHYWSPIMRLANNPMSGLEAADTLCNRAKVEPDDVCVYVGRGRDKKSVTIPFISADPAEGKGKFFLAEDNNLPIYRLKVFVNPNLDASKKLEISNLAIEICNGNLDAS